MSDTCYGEPFKDLSGPTVQSFIKENYSSSTILVTKILPDHQLMIENELIELCERNSNRIHVDVVVLTGGTGFAPRDVTPEATKAVIHREAPGLVVAMITKSLEKTEMAMLSRMVCGIRHHTLIINLPGSPKACTECLEVVKKPLLHAVSLLRSNYLDVKNTHDSLNIEKSKVVVKVASRNRQSPYTMVEVPSAVATILEEVKKVNLNVVETDLTVDLVGGVLAEDVIAMDAVPSFPASLKDGYAVLVSDGTGIRTVKNSVIPGKYNKIYALVFLKISVCIIIIISRDKYVWYHVYMGYIVH